MRTLTPFVIGAAVVSLCGCAAPSVAPLPGVQADTPSPSKTPEATPTMIAVIAAGSMNYLVPDGAPLKGTLR
ncbi:MAG: hypothetical protein VKP62_15090 [Candidatus Sericytochromatia bacterium]|nr:hypothetical protein [Candidatus Sericytochromatia bacterium]